MHLVLTFNFRKIKLQYVKGHNGEEGNEGADGLAGQGCTMEPLEERDWASEEEKVRMVIASGDAVKRSKDATKQTPDTTSRVQNTNAKEVKDPIPPPVLDDV